MNKKILLPLLILLMMALDGQTQSSGHAIFFNTGYTYNNGMEINDKKVSNSRGYLFTLGSTYQIFKIKNIGVELGLAGKAIFASGTLDKDRFKASTLRLVLPIRAVVPISKKWKLSSGFNFQNNIDFSKKDFKLNDKYFWRVNFITEARYAFNRFWSLTAGLSLNLRNIPDAYFINDPRTSILIGISRRVSFFKKQNK